MVSTHIRNAVCIYLFIYQVLVYLLFGDMCIRAQFTAVYAYICDYSGMYIQGGGRKSAGTCPALRLALLRATGAPRIAQRALISSMSFLMSTGLTLPASPLSLWLLSPLRFTKFLAHLSPAMKSSSFSRTAAEVVAVASRVASAERPKLRMTSRVTEILASLALANRSSTDSSTCSR